ncbi:collagen alpha-1(XXIII) chain [Ictalurus punctatus]|uniref:Collagen alpha-1(XXIII) chain n=1 Tax=Ictalurus punctatus TaxID=7998 RepID=A0A9F7RNK6_ICTPU|nr:collagen alpha-1(XXIII) chain [Ictalurus punctatus]
MRAKTLSKEMVNTNAYTSSFHVFHTVFCLVLSVFSVVFCVVITLRTSHLEHRMQFLESERVSVLSSAPPSPQAANLSLWDAIEKLVYKRLMEEVPKLRTPREVGQECSCPPGPPGRRGRKGNPGTPVSNPIFVDT